MMGWFGPGLGAGAWLLMALFGVALVAPIVWLVTRLLPSHRGPSVSALALVAAVGVLIASVVLVFTGQLGGSARPVVGANGMMGWPGSALRGPGSGMMGTVWLAGDGAKVTAIAAARGRATTAAAPAGLHPGEVIWFDNGFYVELKDSSGESATEVIVDPGSGTVFTEPGPAMMWNTRYGMHGVISGQNPTPTITVQQAQQIATQWVSTNLPGRVVLSPDSYPGYDTSETTTSAGTINGMLSVNTSTGQVWYHSWHGAFIAAQDG
jgi:hypothetical protein